MSAREEQENKTRRNSQKDIIQIGFRVEPDELLPAQYEFFGPASEVEVWGLKYTILFYYDANMVRFNPWSPEVKPEIDNDPILVTWAIVAKKYGDEWPEIPYPGQQEIQEFKDTSNIIIYDTEILDKKRNFGYHYTFPDTTSTTSLSGNGITAGEIVGLEDATFDGTWTSSSIEGTETTEAFQVTRELKRSNYKTQENCIWKNHKVRGSSQVKRRIKYGTSLSIMFKPNNFVGKIYFTLQYFFNKP